MCLKRVEKQKLIVHYNISLKICWGLQQSEVFYIKAVLKNILRNF